MADGVVLDAGSGGATVATDDAGAAGHVQLVKLAYSADGVATPITADANGVEVQLGLAIPAGSNEIGVVGLNAAALAALETTELGATTLAALETIELGATTLSALETINVGNFPADPATQTTLAAVLAAVDGLETNTTGLATQTTLAAVAASVDQLEGYLDTVESLLGSAVPAGTNVIGQVGLEPRTSGGLSIFRSIDLDETEEDVKTSAGQLFGYFIANLSAAARYVKLYNATAANVTVGTTTPVVTIPLAAGEKANVEFTNGIAFGTAICAAATTGLADSDTGAPGANDVVANLFYK